MGLFRASQAVIDCGQNELVLEDICRDSQRLTPGIFRNQIIPRGMCMSQAEPLNEGHLCVISDTSGCLDDQQASSHR
ncbi:hypothetical protein TNCV_3234341 [Trichonephila clavipes]|nr:hypothetical protein TNCV_3234341 [Trichonephila clavipes]